MITTAQAWAIWSCMVLEKKMQLANRFQPTWPFEKFEGSPAVVAAAVRVWLDEFKDKKPRRKR